ncbi:MAG: hypothetical protein NT067_01105 [Candidatus Diapherotrites archaeon]|nr:hypothetical protein [Candidatus Diapherotrites archaeon]
MPYADRFCDPDCYRGVDPDCLGTYPQETPQQTPPAPQETGGSPFSTPSPGTPAPVDGDGQKTADLWFLPYLAVILLILAALLVFFYQKSKKGE